MSIRTSFLQCNRRWLIRSTACSFNCKSLALELIVCSRGPASAGPLVAYPLKKSLFFKIIVAVLGAVWAGARLAEQLSKGCGKVARARNREATFP